MKILVVDDEDIVLDSCRRVLEAEGFEVLLVSCVDEALAAIEDEEPSLFLIDVKMPVHDGIYLMEDVKKKWPGKPIIVMSGYHTAETVKEAVSMGATRFIAKPFTPDELLEAVRQAIPKEESHGKKGSPGN